MAGECICRTPLPAIPLTIIPLTQNSVVFFAIFAVLSVSIVGTLEDLDCGGRAQRRRFRLRTHLPKRRGASLPAAVQKILVTAGPRCVLSWPVSLLPSRQ